MVLQEREKAPIAVFREPVVFERRALVPSAVRDDAVQPRTTPATVGVAALGLGADPPTKGIAAV